MNKQTIITSLLALLFDKITLKDLSYSTKLPIFAPKSKLNRQKWQKNPH